MSAETTNKCAPKQKHSLQNDYNIARSTNAQINALERTQSVPVVNSRPLRVGLDISNVCNASCIFCSAKNGRLAKNDPDAFRKPEWLDHFTPILPFLDKVILSSYEALINPHIEDFILKLRETYTPFNVFTNGKALTAEMSEFLLRNGLTTMNCSFHSPHPATYEGIMKGLSFDEVFSNLIKLKLLARKYNPAFELTMVFCAMKRNIKQLVDYVDLAHRVGAKSIQVNYLLVTDNERKMEGESIFFCQETYNQYVYAATLKAQKLGIFLNHQPYFLPESEKNKPSPCYRPWEHLIVSKNGDITVCCGGAGILGNIFEDDFYSVWNNKTLQMFRRKVNSDNPPPACQKCSRGRENPNDIAHHIKYLKGLPDDERAQRSKEMIAEYGE
jgi:MoaA/NifB/PqqE/SkfB family radical SAM enzyme